MKTKLNIKDIPTQSQIIDAKQKIRQAVEALKPATQQSEIDALTATPIRLSGRMIEVEIIGGDSALQDAIAKKLQADFEARQARKSRNA